MEDFNWLHIFVFIVVWLIGLYILGKGFDDFKDGF